MSSKGIHVHDNVIEFYDDEGSHRVAIVRPSALAEDVYIELPLTSGTAATETYVNNATGGLFRGLAADYTNTDATSTPADVTGMSFEVEANRTYVVEGMLVYFDDASYRCCTASFTVPSGTTCSFFTTRVRPGLPGSSSYGGWDGTSGFEQQYSGNGFTGYHGIIRTAGTGGTVQLQFTNTAGDGTEQGFRKGTYFRVIDPQG